MKASDFFSLSAKTLKSIIKILLLSRKSTVKNLSPAGPLVIMGNGPSLNQTIAEHIDLLEKVDTMSVNFAPLAQVFSSIRPKFHILADPLFFADNPPANVTLLYQVLGRVDWPMTLLVPHSFRRSLHPSVLSNINITVKVYNPVGAEGFSFFENFVYSRRLAMPRPRNVLVPAIMCGIWSGYRTIYITGADHSWMQSISVDDQNHVISVQPHFYRDDESEQKRIDTTYRGLRLHDIVHSFYTAFRSYHILSHFADKRHIEIFNSTPGSFIDAFDRKPLPDRT